MNAFIIKPLAAIALSAFALGAMASTPCTDAPRDKWLPQQDVKASLEKQGYNVKRLKVDDGCYEAYVTGKDGKKLELKINPVDGAVVEEESK